MHLIELTKHRKQLSGIGQVSSQLKCLLKGRSACKSGALRHTSLEMITFGPVKPSLENVTQISYRRR